MKILHVFKTWLPDTQGGIEECIRVLARDPRGRYQAGVLTLSPAVRVPDCIDVDGIPVHRLPVSFSAASTPVLLRHWGHYRQVAEAHDLLHFHFPWPFADLLHLAMTRHRPAVVTYHSDIVRQRLIYPFYRPLMHAFLGHAERIVATSPAYAQSSEVLRAHRTRVDVIPLGIEDRAGPAPSRPALAGEDPYFLFVGVLRYYKGLDFLLEAARGAPWRLLIVGDGPERARCAARIAELGLVNVQLLGFQPDDVKFALLAHADGVVLPSHLRSEAFGVTLLEAAMCGRPMVSTEMGTGTSYANLHGETGLTVPPADAAALRQALDALHDNAALRARCGAAARQRYLQHFTAEAVRDAYTALYRRTLAHHRI